MRTSGSPSYNKSPGKDYGIDQRIEGVREKLIAGHERWLLARLNGVLIVCAIHNVKEKARTSGAGGYPPELETYCIKLKVATTIMEDLEKDSEKLLREVDGLIGLVKSMNDKDEIETMLLKVKAFITRLTVGYKNELKIKSHVLGKISNIYDWNSLNQVMIPENIAHASTTYESQALVALWSYTGNTELDCMLIQLKTSPPHEQWS